MTTPKNKATAKHKGRKSAFTARDITSSLLTTRGSRGYRSAVGKIVGLNQPITVERVRSGLPVQSVTHLGKRLHLNIAEIRGSLNLSKQTYARRKSVGILTADESDRVVRYAQLLALATELLGDEEGAAHWLKTPAPALGNETPLMQATTELGARNVERLIGRLEHGIPT